MTNCKFTAFILAVLTTVSLAVPASAQEKWYFVDGFHGGVYGHFPLDTYTGYLNDLLETRPEWSMCLEIEPETWDSVAVHSPASYERFKEWVSSPRVEFTNPAYAQPYMYNISGESIIRQLKYGMDKIWAHFPNAEFLTYAVEEPCFTSALPTVLSQLGFKYASIKCPNTCWGGYSAGFGNGNVDWTGPDGSVILANPRYECEELGDKVWETKANGAYKSYFLDCVKAGIERPVGMCYQDAGWRYGPWLDQFGKWMKDKDNLGQNIKYVTWREYFENEPEGTSHQVYRMPQEDVLGGLVWGSQVLQRLSQQVRSAENKLVMTEKTAAMLNMQTGKAPDQSLIDEAWRTLMLSQHHDCWIVPYNRLNKRGTWADNVALWTEASEKNCDDVIASMVSSSVSGSSIEYGIVNTAAFSRNETVSADIPSGWPEDFRITDAAGKNVPYYVDGGKAVFKADAPALGIASYKFSREGKSTRVIPSVKTYSKDSGPVKVSAGQYTLTLSPDEGGVITSLVSNGKEYVDMSSGKALNMLSGWFYEQKRWHLSSEEPATVEVSSAKGIATKITVKGSIASTPFTQEILIEEGSRRIGFSLNIDWKKNVGIGKSAQRRAYDNRQRAFYDSRYDLNVLFPVACKEPSLYKDAPFDVCESQLEDTYFDRWDGIKHNIILDWVDLCGKDGRSIALLSDHTTSYTYGPDYPLALTVQFSGNGLWGRNYSITRPTNMRYALVPHKGKWDEAAVQEESQAWNEPLTAVPGASSKAALLDLEGTGYVVSALCVADGGYLLRLYNASGDSSARKIKLSVPAESVTEVNLLGKETGRPSVKKDGDGVVIEASIPRFGIKTFKIN